MANMCSNTLKYSGEEYEMDRFERNVIILASHQHQMGVSLLADPRNFDRYMFDLYIDDTEIVTFMTKWGPDFKMIENLHKKYNLSFKLYYYEPGSHEYGEYEIIDGIPSHKLLEDEDFKGIEYLENSGTYLYKDEEWESEEELWEFILRNKYKTK